MTHAEEYLSLGAGLTRARFGAILNNPLFWPVSEALAQVQWLNGIKGRTPTLQEIADKTKGSTNDSVRVFWEQLLSALSNPNPDFFQTVGSLLAAQKDKQLKDPEEWWVTWAVYHHRNCESMFVLNRNRQNLRRPVVKPPPLTKGLLRRWACQFWALSSLDLPFLPQHYLDTSVAQLAKLCRRDENQLRDDLNTTAARLYDAKNHGKRWTRVWQRVGLSKLRAGKPGPKAAGALIFFK